MVTIKAATLEKLSEGAHTVKLSFDDGSITTQITVAAASKTPKTGDTNQIDLWSSMMALSLLGLAGMILVRRKRRVD